MKTVTYTIPNINCMHCVHTITSEIGELDGVKTVNANVDTKVATIAFDTPATEELIVTTLKAINYPPQLS
jgi:copper chaperone CopZ